MAAHKNVGEIFGTAFRGIFLSFVACRILGLWPVSLQQAQCKPDRATHGRFALYGRTARVNGFGYSL